MLQDGYDPHGRQNQITDARNGTTILTYNNAGHVQTLTTPAPTKGQPAQTTPANRGQGKVFHRIPEPGQRRTTLGQAVKLTRPSAYEATSRMNPKRR